MNIKFIYYFVLVLFLIPVIAIAIFFYCLKMPLANNTAQSFIVQPGDGVHQISQRLYQQNLIRSRFVFETYIWYKDLEKKFIAGSFVIPANKNNIDLVGILTSFQADSQLTIRFIEGWTSSDMAAYLLDLNVITDEQDFLDVIKVSQWQQQYDFLKDLDPDNTLEGYLFPDTYHFLPQVTPNQIVDKLLFNFSQKFSEELQQAVVSQNRSIYDVIKLASMLEKEVKTEKDMSLVADIFLRRLQQGMLLQADSTLNYATGGKNSSLSAAELAIDSPYNSYKYYGLPPTPISNPGLKAIRAAVYPEKNDFLFFLTSPDGTTYYAKTFTEHTINRQYLR